MEFEIKHDVELAPYTTLKLGGKADVFIEVSSKEQLADAVRYAQECGLPLQVLGGGSNVLVADSGFRGCVIRMNIQGIESTIQGDAVFVTVGAGESLDSVVAYTVAQGWWGMENLSHIPGTVGATPVQNVGAYGTEVSSLIDSVEVFDTHSGLFRELSLQECVFGYRDSLFKKAEGKKYIICSVTFTLSQQRNPSLSYKDLSVFFEGNTDVSLVDIRKAVISIRSEKFPDWSKVGTAGSFFKNPIITQAQSEVLKKEFPLIPAFPTPEGGVKISLGYVLDKVLGLRGHSEGLVRLFEKQALVLVAEQGARSADVKKFASEVIAAVKNKINITVEMEVTEIF